MQDQQGAQEALIVSRGSSPLGGVTVAQAWHALQLWAQGDARFLPGFVTVEVIAAEERTIRKRVTSKAGADRAADVREQVSTIHPGWLVTHEYTDGPWFLSLTGLDLGSSTPSLFVTTLRHTQHPDYQDPAITAARHGVARPPDAQQNADRVMTIIRDLVGAGVL